VIYERALFVPGWDLIENAVCALAVVAIMPRFEASRVETR
jgi:hypothetical protein